MNRSQEVSDYSDWDLLPSIHVYLVFFSEPPATFTKTLSDASIFECQDVVMACEVSRANAKVEWFKNGKPLKATGKKLRIVKEGVVHKLIITDAAMMNGAKYTARVGKEQTSGTLNVMGTQPCWMANALLCKSLFDVMLCQG